MGRTVIPVRYEVEAQLLELQRYTKSLRKEDLEHFERIYAGVKRHISSVSYANPLNPVELMQWSAILELSKEIVALQKKLEKL